MAEEPPLMKGKSIFVTQQFRYFQDEYTVVGSIGEPGQFGVAFEAYRKDDPNKKRFCVKEINKARFHTISAAQRKDIMETMQNEISTLKMVEHDNIVSLYDVYEDRHRLHLVMEFLPGGELFERIAEVDGFNEADAAKYIKQILSALDHCHDKSILHLDLKPENIIFSSKAPDAQVKLIDFGMARVIPRLSKLRDTVGTPVYMAPEVLDGNYSKGADVWSTGVVLFCMLFGYPPFFTDESETIPMGKEDQAVKDKIRAGFDPTVQDGYGAFFPQDIPVSDNCMKLIAKMLEPDVKKRYTVKECLSSAWIRGEVGDNSIPPKHRQALLGFRQTCKFKNHISNLFAEHLDPDEISDVKKFFSSFDENGDGTISLEEFKKGIMADGSGFGKVTEKDLETIFKNIDTDDSRGITVDEFVTMAAHRSMIAEDERLYSMFLEIDLDGNGVVSEDEFKQAMGKLGPEKAKKFQTVFEKGDINNDGSIDYEEFIKLLHPDFNEDQSFDEFVGAHTGGRVRGATFNVEYTVGGSHAVLAPTNSGYGDKDHPTVNLDEVTDVAFLFGDERVVLKANELIKWLQTRKEETKNDLKSFLQKSKAWDIEIYRALNRNGISTKAGFTKLKQSKFDDIVRKIRVEKTSGMKDLSARNKFDKKLVALEKLWKSLKKSKKK